MEFERGASTLIPNCPLTYFIAFFLGTLRIRRRATRSCVLAALCLAASLAARAEEDKPLTAEDFTPEMRDSVTPPDPGRTIPFEPGMRLTYRIGWGWFTVGSAVISVEAADLGGEEALKFTLVARTNSFADGFYRVRNTTSTWTDPEMSRTLHYTNDQNEGSRERMVVIEVDPEENTVQYSNLLSDDVREPISVLPGTWDPMGITFYVGTFDLTPGRQLVVPTTNGRELFLTAIRVGETVERRFAVGRRQAILLEPDIKDLGGVFSRSDDSGVRLWFATEGPPVPLRMESKVSVGSFWAELAEIEGVD